MYSVYVILSESGILYVGQTDNLSRRLEEHNAGVSFYTRRSKSWKLVYKEEYATRSEAMKREKVLKSGKGRDFLKRLVSGP